MSMLRALNATVTDHPFMSDRVGGDGTERVLSRRRSSATSRPATACAAPATPPLGGPEFQILTSVTALERANFVGVAARRPLRHRRRRSTTRRSRAWRANAAALVDYCNLLFMGGRMSAAERTEIINAVSVTAGHQRRRSARARRSTLTLAVGAVPGRPVVDERVAAGLRPADGARS